MKKLLFVFLIASISSAKELPRVFANGFGQYISVATVTGKNLAVRYIDGNKTWLQKTAFENKPEGAVQIQFKDKRFPEPYQFFDRAPASFDSQCGMLMGTADLLVRCGKQTMTYLPMIGEKFDQFMNVARAAGVGMPKTPCDAITSNANRHGVGETLTHIRPDEQP